VQYEFLFEGGSLLSVPEPWRDVYGRYLGAVDPAEFEQRLRFVVGKYREHRAIPTKFDGIGCKEEGDAKYDDPAYYFELWEESREYRNESPRMSEIAEGVLYQDMRSGIMQKTLDDYAAEHGTMPVRVVTPEELLQGFEQE